MKKLKEISGIEIRGGVIEISEGDVKMKMKLNGGEKKEKEILEIKRECDFMVNDFFLESNEVVCSVMKVPMEICSICLEDFTMEDTIVDTICKHHFHARCYLGSILSTTRLQIDGVYCPYCRYRTRSLVGNVNLTESNYRAMSRKFEEWTMSKKFFIDNMVKLRRDMGMSEKEINELLDRVSLSILGSLNSLVFDFDEALVTFSKTETKEMSKEKKERLLFKKKKVTLI